MIMNTGFTLIKHMIMIINSNNFLLYKLVQMYCQTDFIIYLNQGNIK